MARGSIRQRSKVRKDSWTVQVYLGRDPSTGKKRYRSEAVRGTRAQAERRLTEILREIDMGSSVPKPSGLTVGEYLEGWLRDPMEARVRLRTLEGYQLHVRGNIVPRIGAVPLGRLTVRQVQDMEADLLRSGGRDGRGLSPRTVIHVHRVLYTALKHALRLELVSRNVAAAVQPPRAPRYQARTLTWDEARSFFAGVPNQLFRSIFLLAFQTGLRRSEILGLQWRDVDLSGGFLSVRRGLVKLSSDGAVLNDPKSGRGRVVDLGSDAIRGLRSHLESFPGNGNFVFCHSGGEPLQPASVSKAFQRAASDAGLEGLRFHDLRHTHASLMLAEGVHLKVVSERLGHSSIAITADTYSHVQPTVQRGAADRFSAAWEGGDADPDE